MRHFAQQRFDSCFQSIAKMREWPEGCCLVSNLFTLCVKSLHQDDVCRVAASPAKNNDEYSCPALTCNGGIIVVPLRRKITGCICPERRPHARIIVFDKLWSPPPCLLYCPSNPTKKPLLPLHDRKEEAPPTIRALQKGGGP